MQLSIIFVHDIDQLNHLQLNVDIHRTQMQDLSSMRTHHIPSIPLRLGPLLSHFYTTVSTLTCSHTLPCKSIVCKIDLNCIQNVDPHHITSLPLRLGPLPSECNTTTSVRTHHRASIPLRLGPLPSECYYMESTYEYRHTPYNIIFLEHITTTYQCHPCLPQILY